MKNRRTDRQKDLYVKIDEMKIRNRYSIFLYKI